jgi:cell wall-associated NlpC family hydrolase
MGTPYRWGGSDAAGYDCWGLIQFAYAEHGILLPRVSRDQARIGVLVERDIEALLPGDILGFAASGSGITHVGLYVGEGLFIHSASTGVKLSSLNGTDPDSRWWRQRWAVARRILN